jgi:perosamine synthetase
VRQIPGTMPHFGLAEIEFVLSRFREILEGKSFLSQGKYCAEFEHAFASYHGSRHGVAVSSGTAALEAMLRAARVEGCEVIVPANTFAATAFAVINAGGIPVFADVAADLALDPESAEEHVTDRTRAVVAVHVGGLISQHVPALIQLCHSRNLALLEDAAHAHGSSLHGRKAGRFGVAAAFSFFSTKVMTTGEGGMVLTDDEAMAQRIRLLRDQAKVPQGMYQNYHEEIGFNWRMTEVQALMGMAQLRSLDDFVRRRNEIAEIYHCELRQLVGSGLIEVLAPPAGSRHNYYKFVVFLKGTDRVQLARRMHEEFGVSLGGFVYEIPLHLQPALRAYARGVLPVAEDLCSRHVCLPLFFTMTDQEARYTAKALGTCLS